MRRRIGTATTRTLAFIGLSLAAAGLAGAAQAEPLVDRAQLESWADAYYGQAIAEKRSPGITISVVQDGEVILAKGYGYSDYGKHIPVDPETSARQRSGCTGLGGLGTEVASRRGRCFVPRAAGGILLLQFARPAHAGVMHLPRLRSQSL